MYMSTFSPSQQNHKNKLKGTVFELFFICMQQLSNQVDVMYFGEVLSENPTLPKG